VVVVVVVVVVVEDEVVDEERNGNMEAKLNPENKLKNNLELGK
jgi:hypothetical protein